MERTAATIAPQKQWQTTRRRRPPRREPFSSSLSSSSLLRRTRTKTTLLPVLVVLLLLLEILGIVRVEALPVQVQIPRSSVECFYENLKDG